MHKNMRYLSAVSLWRQHGIATLLMSLVLLLSTTIVTFTTARTGLMEQHISNNEYRAKEVHQAAEAGLEYGIAWLADNPWSNGDPTPPAPSITASAHTYAVNLTFTDPGNSGYIKVTSVAQSVADASITATVLQYVRQRDPVLSPDALIGPPLALKGCLSEATGTPHIYPSNYDFPSAGVAVATSQPDDGSGNDCIDWGHIDPHGGSIEGNAFTGTAWDQIFNISKADFQALVQAEIDAGVANRSYHWITSSDHFHSSLGSPSHPVILVFAAAANCPKINGGPTIYGIVFIDSDCVANGWGGAEVYGSVIVEGDVSKINSNTVLKDFSLAEEEWDWSQVNKPRGTNKILGTWKDF